jgi:hypothetical protein
MGNKQSSHSTAREEPPLTPIIRVEKWEIPEKRYDSGTRDFIIAQVPPPLTTPYVSPHFQSDCFRTNSKFSTDFWIFNSHVEYVVPPSYDTGEDSRWRTGPVSQEIFNKIFNEAGALSTPQISLLR